MTAARMQTLIGWSIIMVAIAVVAGVTLERGLAFQFDFHHFYRDAKYIWQHGNLNPDLDNPNLLQRRQLPFYLPAIPLLISPIAFAGPMIGAIIWSVLQVAAFAGCLWLLVEWIPKPGAIDPPRVLLLGFTVLLSAAPLFEAAKFNQLSFATLLLVLLGVRGTLRGSGISGGIWFALAALLKLLPAVFFVWLLLKRRWLAAAAYIVTFAAVAVIPCLVRWGPQQTWEYHREWWSYNVAGDSSSGLVNPELREHFLNHQNQSIAAVIARIAWPSHPYPAPIQFFDWSQQMCSTVAKAIAGGLALVLLWRTRRAARDLAPSSLRQEAAVYALAMVAFSPLLRQYYLIWALPALAILITRVSLPRGATVAWVAVGVWLLSMAAWASPIARDYGANMIALFVIGGLLLVSRNSTTIKPVTLPAGTNTER